MMKYLILPVILLCAITPFAASANRDPGLKRERRGLVSQTQNPIGNISQDNLSVARKGLKFDGAGPFSFDYLLGVNEFKDSKFDVIFIDYDMSAKEIQEYINAGKSVICYVNVGAWENWRSDAGDFPSGVLGKDYEGWPGEKWLDIRKLDVLLPIMRARFQTALKKGCGGIDPDNMNGYTIDTGFGLKYNDQIAYNVAIAKEIRSLGMLAGMKNDNDQAKDLVEFYDFAVLESCAVYDECSIMDVFIRNDKPVFAIEYTNKWSKKRFKKEVCPLVKKSRMAFILKRLNLKGDYVVSCL